MLIPWENVFVYGNFDSVQNFIPASGLRLHPPIHAARADPAVRETGFHLRGVVQGLAGHRHLGVPGGEAQLGEVVAWRNLCWGLSDAMVKSPMPWIDGTMLPNLEYWLAYRAMAPTAYARVKEIIEQSVASGLIYVNSNVADFKSAEIRPYLDKYVCGSNGMEALDRMKIMKLLWDAVGTEFGGCHELYERNYAVSNEAVRFETLGAAQAMGVMDQMEALVDSCMSDYDVDGWTTPDYINPTDVSQVGKFN